MFEYGNQNNIALQLIAKRYNEKEEPAPPPGTEGMERMTIDPNKTTMEAVRDAKGDKLLETREKKGTLAAMGETAKTVSVKDLLAMTGVISDEYSPGYYNYKDPKANDNLFYGVETTIGEDGKRYSKEMPNIQLDEVEDYIIFTDTKTNQVIDKMPKQWQEKIKLKDIYTADDLAEMKNEKLEWSNMTDEEWNKYIDTEMTMNKKLDNYNANRKAKAQTPFTEEQIAIIQQQPPISLSDYIIASAQQEHIKPTLERAVKKYNRGEDLEEDELNAIRLNAIYKINIEMRGVSFQNKLFTGVVTNLTNNLTASVGTVATNFGTTLIGTKILNPLIGTTAASLAAKAGISNTSKIYKVGKYFVNTAAKAASDYYLKTVVFDKIGFSEAMGIPTEEQKYRDKKLNKILELTDKGVLNIKKITTEDEQFLKRQTKIEGFTEALSERALDPLFDTFGYLFNGYVKNNIEATGFKRVAAKTIQMATKINNIPKIAGTTFDGLLGEHAEELFGITMNHLLRANDPDTTLHKAIKEYMKPENFTLSTLNIWIAGGLFHQMSNAITGGKKNIEPISDKVIRTKLTEAGMEQEEINSKLNTLTTKQKDNIATQIILKESREQEERFQFEMDNLAQAVSQQFGEEYAANWKAVTKVGITNIALRLGSSRHDIMQNLKMNIQPNSEQITNDNAKGITEFRQADAVIKLFKNKADKSTLLHETAHYFLELLKRNADNGSESAKEMINMVKEMTGASNIEEGRNLVSMHERFARGFEQYLRSNFYNDNLTLKTSFDYFRSFLQDIYENGDDLQVEIHNPQMWQFFNQYIFNPLEYTEDSDWIYYTGGDEEKKEKSEIEKKKEFDDLMNYLNSDSAYELMTLAQGADAEEIYNAVKNRIEELKKQKLTPREMEEDEILGAWLNTYIEQLQDAVDEMAGEELAELYRFNILGEEEFRKRTQGIEFDPNAKKETKENENYEPEDIPTWEIEKKPKEESSQEKLKQRQLEILNKVNPMLDNTHTGIRKVEDIKTFEEAIQDEESFVYGDYTKEDALRDLKKGKIKVYSSKDFKEGDFVSTSYNMAKDYAGNGKVNEKIVDINEIAWINGDEGNYLPSAVKKEDKQPIQEKTKEKKSNDKIKRSESQSEYQKQKIESLANKFQKSFVETQAKQNINTEMLEKINKIMENQGTISEGKTFQERTQSITDNIDKFINKIFSKSIAEEEAYIQKLFEKKNQKRAEIEKMGKDEGYDYGIRPYANVNEMLRDYEKLHGRDYWQQRSVDNRRNKEDRYGNKATDYELSYEEYQNIVNFRKRYLKKAIKEYQEIIEDQQKEIVKAQSRFDAERDHATRQMKRIKELTDQVKEMEDLQKKVGVNIKTLGKVEESMGILRDVTLRDKILKYSSGGRSDEYVLKKIDEYKNKELRMDFQNTINKILEDTVHVVKRTGKIYGNTLYEDTGLVTELKKINKYGKRKASEELLKLDSDRAEGKNTDTLKEYELKRQLLFFRSTDNIDSKLMSDITNKLGDFVEESKRLQDRIRVINASEIIEKKREVIEAVKNTKTTGKSLLQPLISHFGNMETMLKYTVGAEKAKEFDMLSNEMAYKHGVKKKTDSIFNKIREVVGGKDKKDNSKIEKIFKEYTEPVTTVELKRAGEKNKIYNIITLNEPLDNIKNEIRTIIETAPNVNNDLLKMLDGIQPQYKKGSSLNYHYRISQKDLQTLFDIINYLQYETEDNARIDAIMDKVKNINPKEYMTELENYKIDLWGVMQYELQSRNPATRKLIERYYTDETIKRLDEIIENSPKEFHQIADILFDAVQDRAELNPYYVLEFNRDMGNVTNYFPRRSLHETDTSLFDMSKLLDNERKVTAVENRSINAIPDFNVNPLLLALTHISQTEYTTNMAPKLKMLHQVFAPEVIDAISEKKGKNAGEAVRDFIDNLKDTIPAQETDMEKIISLFVGNWAKSVTNTPSVLVKQMTSFIPYTEGISMLEFSKNYLKGITGGGKTRKFMEDISPYIQDRFNQDEYKSILEIIRKKDNSLTDDIISVFKNLKQSIANVLKKTPLLNKLTRHDLVEIGDIISVIYGGYARYQTQIDNGMSHEEAIKDFEQQTAKTQQSRFKSLQTRGEVTGQDQSSRFARMFTSQDMQNFNKVMQNIVDLGNKDKSWGKALNNILIYNIILPIFMTAVSGAIDKMYDKKERTWGSWIAEGVANMIASLLPYKLLKSTEVIHFATNYKELKEQVTTIDGILITLGVLTGYPIWTVKRLLFNRQYQPDLYDSDAEKQRKEKRKRQREIMRAN